MNAIPTFHPRPAPPAQYQIFYRDPDEPKRFPGTTFVVQAAPDAQAARQAFANHYPGWTIESVKELKYGRQISRRLA